ncbi:MAG: SIS domain-containing protein [Planctomycetota bacterium]
MTSRTPDLRDLSRLMLDDLAQVLSRVDPAQVSPLIDHIASARRVFVCGAGRSGLVVRAFAQRLMQLGISVCVVGETTTPRARPGDLLLAASCTGERPTTLAIARQAKKARVRVCALIGKPASTLARIADLRVILHAPAVPRPRDPFLGATLFEDSLLILLDAVAWLLSRRKGLSRRIGPRHANLE